MGLLFGETTYLLNNLGHLGVRKFYLRISRSRTSGLQSSPRFFEKIRNNWQNLGIVQKHPASQQDIFMWFFYNEGA
jgi:hypothetical protein